MRVSPEEGTRDGDERSDRVETDAGCLHQPFSRTMAERMM